MAAHDSSSSRTADILFDIRTIIGGLFGVYGVVCLVAGLVSFTPSDAAKTGGFNLNLWSGVAMLVLSAGFLTWVLARPLHPADDQLAEDQPADQTQAP